MPNEPTVISAIILSDVVIREAGTNKLTLVGTFSQWNAPGFPFVAPQHFVTAYVSNLREGPRDPVPLVWRIENDDGHVLWSISGKIKLKEGPLPPAMIIDIVAPVQGLNFHQPGRYKIVLLFDGEQIGQRYFHVESISATAPNPPPKLQ